MECNACERQHKSMIIRSYVNIDSMWGNIWPSTKATQESGFACNHVTYITQLCALTLVSAVHDHLKVTYRLTKYTKLVQQTFYLFRVRFKIAQQLTIQSNMTAIYPYRPYFNMMFKVNSTLSNVPSFVRCSLLIILGLLHDIITCNIQTTKWVNLSFVLFNSYSASHDNWCTATLWNRIMTVQCEGMWEVGSVRYEPALLPPCPSIRVLSYSNCQEIHSRQQTGLAV